MNKSKKVAGVIGGLSTLALAAFMDTVEFDWTHEGFVLNRDEKPCVSIVNGVKTQTADKGECISILGINDKGYSNLLRINATEEETAQSLKPGDYVEISYSADVFEHLQGHMRKRTGVLLKMPVISDGPTGTLKSITSAAAPF